MWLRRIIYLSFIACFLVVAPVLVLYSMGYRYHWEKHRFERTGLIIVDGEPHDAVVTVDGTVRATRLPAHLGGLGENEYTIHVARDGFTTWQERVTVVSGTTTFLSDLRLFRTDPPTRELDGMVSALSTSADGLWAAAVRTTSSFDELWMVNLRTEERTLAIREPRTVDGTDGITFTWSPREAALLVTTPTHDLVIDATTPRRSVLLTDGFAERPRDIAWELGSVRSLAARSSGVLYRIPLSTGRAVALSVLPAPGPYAVSRQTLYSFDAETHTILATPTSGGAPTTLAALPANVMGVTFLNLRGTQLTIATTVPRQTWTIEVTTGAITQRAGSHFRTAPHDERAAIWFASAHEVWAELGAPPQRMLVARREQPIVAAVWQPDAPYLFVATAQDIQAIALRSSATHQPTRLAAFDATFGIAITTQGEALLIAGTREDRTGLWRLPLR